MAKIIKKLEDGTEMRKVSFYSVKLVREKEDEYITNEAITSPVVIDRICREVLELDQQAQESMYLFTLNTKNKINGIFEVSRGTLNASIVHPRDIYQRAVLQNANSIMIAHNHPSGDPTPSKEDIDITERLVDAGNILGIKLLDHIIIGDNRYISFGERRLI